MHKKIPELITSGENWEEIVNPEQYESIVVEVTQRTDPRVIRYYSSRAKVVLKLDNVNQIEFMARCLNVTLSD